MFIGVPISLIALIGFTWWMKSTLEEKIAKRLEEQLSENLLKRKETELAEFVKNQSFENRIKTERKILIVSKNRKEQGQFDILIKMLGFQNLEHKIIKQHEQLPVADLVIFNQFESGEIISKFFESSLPIPFIGYYPHHNSPIFKDKRFSLVNYEHTLYSLIVELFKFKEHSKHS